MTERYYREVPAARRRRPSHQPWLLVLCFAACDSGRSAPVAPVLPPGLVEAIIGPGGGALGIADGPHAGVSLSVPPGAVTAPTRFTIAVDTDHPQIVDLFPVYRFEPRDLDTGGVPLTVTVRAGDALFDGADGADTLCFWQPEPGAPWQAMVEGQLDPLTRRVVVATPRLGDFVAWNGGLHRLFTQDRQLLDPAAPTAIENLGGVPVTLANGSVTWQVGRGSLQSFWRSPARENVLILHGLLGSPLDFLGSDDLVANLSPTVQNIVLLAYPSASGVAVTANLLYDEVQRQRQPGFGCSIVTHSLGGLVGRYLLERSAGDPARPAYVPGAPPLSDVVADLVLLGVPNAGSELGNALAETLLQRIRADQQPLLQAAVDLSFRPEAVTMLLNANYVDNATRYHIVYGDLGFGSDGVVTVASALALPLFGAETLQGFPVGHDALHTEAAQHGIAAHIDALLAARR